MIAVMSFCGLCVLLVLGKIIRTYIPLFQRLYLPASVIGGGLGLLIITIIGDRISPEWYASWSKLPGFLINIVFASLFLGVRHSGRKGAMKLAMPQICFGQITAWGQYVVGLAVVLLFLGPLFGVPNVFGNLIEIGFEGGHGTVGGLARTFDQLGWKEGADLGYTMATAGMIFGIVIGMVLINIAARRGDVSNIRTFDDLSLLERRGIYRFRRQPAAGRETVHSDSVDSLALHIAVIGIAVLIGFGMKEGLALLNHVAPGWIRETHILASFPLFPLCMIGGLILQYVLRKTKAHVIVDGGQMQHLSGAALDFLVVSAVASIQIKFVIAYWLPLLILIVAGTLWNVALVWYLGPRIFKEAWFERSIAEFGQSMGVTATGLLLLRTVDPENKTCASSAFGYKQLFHEPIMGGGIWTSLAVPLVIQKVGVLVLGICLAFLLMWFTIWRCFFYVKTPQNE